MVRDTLLRDAALWLGFRGIMAKPILTDSIYYVDIFINLEKLKLLKGGLKIVSETQK